MTAPACCPQTGCGAAMERGEDSQGVFYHCRECGMDWDAEDVPDHQIGDGDASD